MDEAVYKLHSTIASRTCSSINTHSNAASQSISFLEKNISLELQISLTQWYKFTGMQKSNSSKNLFFIYTA